VAARLEVDPKTVQRWIAGRLPRPHSRHALADLLGVDEVELWPQARRRFGANGVTDEVVAVYPRRSSVPMRVWRGVFESATAEIGVLAYSGLFLAEDLGVVRLLVEKARSGLRVRILLGDPDSPHVSRRGDDEGIGDAMAAKIRNALALYRPLRDIEGVEFRLHRTTLYNSIYFADAEILVNPHVYGTTASSAPVMHVRATSDDGMAKTYLDSFDRVWRDASPAQLPSWPGAASATRPTAASKSGVAR
jgi:hypothetical protein